MGTAILSNDITDALDPSFTSIKELEIGNAVTTFDRIFNILESSRSEEKRSAMTDIANMQIKPEHGPITPATYKQKYDKTYTHVNYAIKTEISEEAYKNDLSTGKLQRIPKLHVRSGINCAESIAADVFDTASSSTGPDSSYLFATDHPTPLSSTTFANTPSTATALSVGAFEDSVLRQEAQLTDAGNPMFLTLKYLLVATANMLKAKKILQSANTPFEMSNTKNVLQNYNFELIVWKYLTQTTLWATLADKQYLEFYFYWREKYTTKLMVDPNNPFDAIYFAKEWFSCGQDEWRGVDGDIG